MSVKGGFAAAESEKPWLRWVGANIATGLGRLMRPVRFGARPIWRAYRRIAVATLASIAVLLIVMLTIDVAMIEVARQAPRWLHNIFQVVTRLGRAEWFLWPLGLGLLLTALITSPSLPWMSRAVLAMSSVRLGFLFLAIAVPGLVSNIAKVALSRARPRLAQGDPFLYSPFDGRMEFASMPSGHATTVFAAAIAFGALWPRLRPLLWTFAVLVAATRFGIATHFPSDVVAGAIIGCVGALLVRDWFAARGLGFVVGADGSVKPLPGPSFTRIKGLARRLVGQ